jgi:hypothetical protein
MSKKSRQLLFGRSVIWAVGATNEEIAVEPEESVQDSAD